MASIKLLYGTGVTSTNPPKVDGHLLFDIGSKSIYFDVNGDRIKLYESLDTAITDITDLKTKVGTETVAKQIADAIANLKKTVVADVENSDTVTLSLADNADASAKKLKAEVKLSSKADNALKNGTGTVGEEGLYVAPAAAPEYTIEKAATAETGFASTYKLMKDGVQVGASINIAKDKFLKTVELVDQNGEGTAGKFIKMVFEDDTNSTIYLDVKQLVDVYTSGSAAGDMIVVAVDSSTNKITATITDGTVTKEKLATAVQTSLGLADTAVQPSELATAKETNKYIAGITVDGDGNITFEKEILPSLDGLEWGTFTAVSGA